MNKTILRTISLIMAFALTFGMFKPGQAKSVGSPINPLLQMNTSATLSTIVAEADSRVREASPNANFGADTVLNVDGDAGSHVQSYIRFTVTGISGTVSNAQLRIYVTDGTYDGPMLFSTSNTWTETGITWNNRPAGTSGALGDKGKLDVNTWADYDVTSVIRGNGTYSFVLTTYGTDLLGLSSREGNAAPQLVVTLADSSTTTLPTATPTTIQPTPTGLAPTATPTTVIASPTPTTIQ
ncbi:MAG TPA: DNRLRE domain-containing protein, partial [Anaerolineales bacterium]|nr:DNRLRE domain-containing protein [Anaerolineales bacterium]